MKEHVYEARDVLVARLRDDERQAQAEART
jgi:hypothetical protein